MLTNTQPFQSGLMLVGIKGGKLGRVYSEIRCTEGGRNRSHSHVESSKKAASGGLLKDVLKRRDCPTEIKTLKAAFFAIREGMLFSS